MSTNEAEQRLAILRAFLNGDLGMRAAEDALIVAAEAYVERSAGAAPLDEQVAERWLAANDLYAVTHTHVVESCAECRLSEGSDR